MPIFQDHLLVSVLFLLVCLLQTTKLIIQAGIHVDLVHRARDDKVYRHDHEISYTQCSTTPQFPAQVNKQAIFSDMHSCLDD